MLGTLLLLAQDGVCDAEEGDGEGGTENLLKARLEQMEAKQKEMEASRTPQPPPNASATARVPLPPPTARPAFLSSCCSRDQKEVSLADDMFDGVVVQILSDNVHRVQLQ